MLYDEVPTFLANIVKLYSALVSLSRVLLTYIPPVLISILNESGNKIN